MPFQVYRLYSVEIDVLERLDLGLWSDFEFTASFRRSSLTRAGLRVRDKVCDKLLPVLCLRILPPWHDTPRDNIFKPS